MKSILQKLQKKIIIERDKTEIITTNQLVEIIASVKKIRKKNSSCNSSIPSIENGSK